ncbi:uncharacterized protein A4U43_C07F18940 [Asparagus officinalis]|uniref:Uncharacterized protein n=1 Tax=Asparagus officinalis TaxID=4686 RepID=A0A5P1EG35_ASPOF|nr:uncharacterized protein A4U43_C07F18940 [Asparagus officinalis]
MMQERVMEPVHAKNHVQNQHQLVHVEQPVNVTPNQERVLTKGKEPMINENILYQDISQQGKESVLQMRSNIVNLEKHGNCDTFCKEVSGDIWTETRRACSDDLAVRRGDGVSGSTEGGTPLPSLFALDEEVEKRAIFSLERRVTLVMGLL